MSWISRAARAGSTDQPARLSGQLPGAGSSYDAMERLSMTPRLQTSAARVFAERAQDGGHLEVGLGELELGHRALHDARAGEHLQPRRADFGAADGDDPVAVAARVHVAERAR